MKWQEIFILILIPLTGEISHTFGHTREKHVRKRFHVHKPKVVSSKELENLPSEHIDEKVVAAIEFKKHQHNSVSNPEINNSQNHDTSFKKQQAKLSNEININEEALRKNGYFKLTKRLKFRSKLQNHIRQHAAKSFKLNCFVNFRKTVSMKWLKDGQAIESYFER